MATNTTIIPSAAEADDMTPDTLCANWKKGCNGVSREEFEAAVKKGADQIGARP